MMRSRRFKHPEQIIEMLVDIISEWLYAVNVLQQPDGTFNDAKPVLSWRRLAKWFADLSGRVYGTRPFRVFGERRYRVLVRASGRETRWNGMVVPVSGLPGKVIRFTLLCWRRKTGRRSSSR